MLLNDWYAVCYLTPEREYLANGLTDRLIETAFHIEWYQWTDGLTDRLIETHCQTK